MTLTQRALICFALTLALLGCGSHAQPVASPAAAPKPAVATTATPSSGLFLYAIGQGEQRSFVMGTMHVGFGFDEVLTPPARAGFAAARTVMIEADVTSTDAAQMMQAALLSSDRSLRTMLGEPLWTQLVARIGDSVPPVVLDKLKPWMPAVIVGLDDMQRALKEVRPNAGAHMMDAELMQAAQKSGKQMLFLETVEEQLAVFTAIPEAEQVAELSRALSEDNTALGKAMLEAFARGDEAALTESLFDEAQMQAAPGFYEAVLFQRNARWLPLIETQLRTGPVFVAVGAAHLFGERGILAELKRRGYAVARVGS